MGPATFGHTFGYAFPLCSFSAWVVRLWHRPGFGHCLLQDGRQAGRPLAGPLPGRIASTIAKVGNSIHRDWGLVKLVFYYWYAVTVRFLDGMAARARGGAVASDGTGRRSAWREFERGEVQVGGISFKVDVEFQGSQWCVEVTATAYGAATVRSGVSLCAPLSKTTCPNVSGLARRWASS